VTQTSAKAVSLSICALTGLTRDTTTHAEPRLTLQDSLSRPSPHGFPVSTRQFTHPEGSKPRQSDNPGDRMNRLSPPLSADVSMLPGTPTTTTTLPQPQFHTHPHAQNALNVPGCECALGAGQASQERIELPAARPFRLLVIGSCSLLTPAAARSPSECGAHGQGL